ncbi:hypothetical protein BGZ61DRAFT_288313, partial [Ilyonectria robusta]|uniref:uncharacterized protein n=1 Tax=Ilyonectria robusta TaxID=1079257 RepID=UPI001E8D42E9
RRPHMKSRNRCSECRRRKVKCGEDKPRCSACVRNEAPCLYPDVARRLTSPVDSVTPINSYRASSASTSYSTQNSCSKGSSSVEEALTSFGMDDMVLFHQWIFHTSRTIIQSPNIDHCWQVTFPNIGFHHPFVMHGILSLAALHLALTDPGSRKQHSLDAARHHNTALRGFREGIDHMVTSEDYSNSDALFACSILNMIYIFGMLGGLHSSLDGKPGLRQRTARVLGGEWIPMVRGIGAIIQPAAYEQIRLGPLAQLVSLDHWEELDSDSDLAVNDEHFRVVPEAWAALPIPDIDVYNDAWRMLRRCYLYSMQFAGNSAVGGGHEGLPSEGEKEWTFNRQWAGSIAFLHETSEEYLLRVHQRQPPALVIFSYFGALLHDLDDYWFLQGWGRDIVEVVNESLGSYWRPWTKWPRQVVGLS